MKNYNVSENNGHSVYDELETNKDIKVGDTISWITNNQQGYMKYKVVLDDEGKKDLKIIETYDNVSGKPKVKSFGLVMKKQFKSVTKLSKTFIKI